MFEKVIKVKCRIKTKEIITFIVQKILFYTNESKKFNNTIEKREEVTNKTAPSIINFLKFIVSNFFAPLFFVCGNFSFFPTLPPSEP